MVKERGKEKEAGGERGKGKGTCEGESVGVEHGKSGLGSSSVEGKRVGGNISYFKHECINFFSDVIKGKVLILFM